MDKLVKLPQRTSEENEFNVPYTDSASNYKWKDVKNRIFLDVSGYNRNKLVKPEYKLKERKKEEVSSNMDDNKLLEKYMDSVNQSIRDMEQRNIQDKREREQRIIQCQQLSEERMEKRFLEAMDAVKNQNEIISSAIAKFDDKIDKMDSKIDDSKKFIVSISLTTILSIAALVITVILTIKSLS